MLLRISLTVGDPGVGFRQPQHAARLQTLPFLAGKACDNRVVILCRRKRSDLEGELGRACTHLIVEGAALGLEDAADEADLPIVGRQHRSTLRIIRTHQCHQSPAPDQALQPSMHQRCWKQKQPMHFYVQCTATEKVLVQTSRWVLIH